VRCLTGKTCNSVCSPGGDKPRYSFAAPQRTSWCIYAQTKRNTAVPTEDEIETKQDNHMKNINITKMAQELLYFCYRIRCG
jgi:hypothetical protein